jgi:Na+/H+-dicarboxylate symporter
LIAGAIVGVGVNVIAARTGWTDGVTWMRALEPMGTAFIRAITMIVIPLVVASLIVGVASLGDLRALGRIGGKTVGYYLSITTARFFNGSGGRFSWATCGSSTTG